MSKKILVMGLPGSGKSTLAEELVKHLDAEWINADKVREEANDWDFSPEGRVRQANRMKSLSEAAGNHGKSAIADFICPTPETRAHFDADVVVWVDTISEGRFEDTNKMFVAPENYDFRITTQNAEVWALKIANAIEPYVWDNRKPTAQMLGRWQPWHDGHQALFEEIIKKTGQVNIQVRDVQGVGDNPFDFETVKSNIESALAAYGNRVRITLVPNITNICYGRGVGYQIEEIDLPDHIKAISATEIRDNMRKSGDLTLDGKLSYVERRALYGA
jgi:nicotinamide riboside kinase